MNNPTRIQVLIIFILFLALIVFAKVMASKILLVEIQPKTLVVREHPTIESKSISIFTKGEKVIASKSNVNGWLMVLVDNKPGYIQAKYTKKVEDSSVKEPIKSHENNKKHSECNRGDVNVSLNIKNIEFNCKEDLFGNGYKSGTAIVDVKLTSDCYESLNVRIKCEAEINYKEKDGFLTKKDTISSSKSVFMMGGTDNTKIELYWEPGFSINPVTYVKLIDCSCSVKDVWSY